jgi:hypothetical protein
MVRIPLQQARDSAARNHSSRWMGRKAPNRIEPECWPRWQPKHPLRPGSKVFTIGSCFARNIEHHLQTQGFDIPMLNIGWLENGEMISDYLNKYTAPAIYQELAWAHAILNRDDAVRDADVLPLILETAPGRFLDMHIRGAGDTDFQTTMKRRGAVYSVFREAFLSDSIVLTLGLCESVYDTQTGLYVPPAPVLFDDRHGSRFEFEQLDHATCYKFTARSVELLTQDSDRKILLTTSPIPLSRTFTKDDVIIANMYSKSVLRAVAGEIATKYEAVDYFPSFESVMLTKQNYVWADDLTHVSSPFVARIVARDSRRGDAILQLCIRRRFRARTRIKCCGRRHGSPAAKRGRGAFLYA